MAATNSSENLIDKIFERIWEIKNWADVIKNETLIENSSTEFQCKTDSLEYVRLLVGLKIFTAGENRNIGFYWKPLSKHLCLDNINADLVVEELKRDGTTQKEYKSQADVNIGVIVDMNYPLWHFPYTFDVTQWTNFEGSWVLRLKLTLKNIPEITSSSKTEEFVKASLDEFGQNLASLFNNKLSSDVKIVTKDKTEFFAHKAILQARCIVFATMFGSTFKESSSGLINIDDISGKTMEILLRYWYTGKLQPSWRDDDIVVEFTYAAGKYQMTHILKMLNDLLGHEFKESDGNVELLRMVHQLSLKNAEARILKLVIYKISQAKNAAELFQLLPLDSDKLDESTLTMSQALKAFDDVLSETNDKDACSRDIKLIALACQNGMKHVEKKLLNRIIGTVNKLESAEEFFAFFEIRNEKHHDYSQTSDLLVRVNAA